MKVECRIYNAFSNEEGKGNPAGVIFDADKLTESQMQLIAKELGYNESVFVCNSSVADVRLRYFTPGGEVPMCGHATIAAVFSLSTKDAISDKVKVGTLSGVLDITVTNDDEVRIGMTQNVYEEIPFDGDVGELAQSMGLTPDNLEKSLPIVYGYTGLWTVLVPIKKLSSFEKMKPNNKLFSSVLTHNPRASLHPFCLETYDDKCQMHGRHFSPAFAGTIEDPVTGTASGVMGAYYKKHIQPDVKSISVEQGNEIGRTGHVDVAISDDFLVTIFGTAGYEKTRIVDV